VNDPITQANIDSGEIFDRIEGQFSVAVVHAMETVIPGKLPRLLLETAIERLDHLAAKEAGWKGPKSVAMPKSVRNASETFLKTNFSSGWMPSLFIGLDADGDVTIFVKTELITMDLSICSDGMYSFYAELSGSQSVSDEGIPVTQPLQDDVMETLRLSPM
jgi:hypothetical protein